MLFGEPITLLGQLFYSPDEKCRELWQGLPAEEQSSVVDSLIASRFIPFLSYRLKGALDKAILEKAKSTQKQLMMQATCDDLALQKLYGDFETQNIRFAPIKGVDLAYRIYPSPFMRPYGDWDILFHPDDIESAERYLHSIGWKDVYHKDKFGGFHDAPMWKGKSCLEPHYTLSGFGAVDPKDIWKHLRIFPGSKCRYVLPPELNLLLIARHASESRYRMVSLSKLLLDAAFLIRKEGVDWEKLKQLCNELHQPYSGNLLAAFTEFFPAEMINEMNASQEQVQAYREIFETRKAFADVGGAEIAMNNDKRFSKEWLVHSLQIYHPMNIRIKYQIRKGEVLKLLCAYLRETIGKFFKLLRLLFFRNDKLSKYMQLIQTAERV